MQTTRLRLLPTLLVAAVTAALGACASAPPRNALLDDAKTSYARAAADAQIARAAPLELRKAEAALKKAEAAQQAGDDAASIDHFATLARQRTEVALQAGKQAQAEQAVADASQQRDRILIESRTREADSQRAMADKARMQAETQRAEAETARKLAADRLSLAQASQARVGSLEEQLAEIKAKKTERGMVLTLGDVLFDVGQAKLSPGAARSLEQLVSFMKQNPERSVVIEGYTDSVGGDDANQVLSERRAIAVKNALVDQGIAANRVSARGLGEASPVATNETATGRQQNRRVEIVISGTA